MIRADEVFKIGKFLKPHGIKGEIAFLFDNDVFDQVDCPYLICQIDGIFVPFIIEEYRFKGKETALMTFEDVDNEHKAMRLSGLDVYFPRKYYDEDMAQEDIDYSWNFFLGFTAIDKNVGELGTIVDIDDKTMNVLFLIKQGEKEYIIPANEDFITGIDSEKKILHLELMEGIIDIQ